MEGETSPVCDRWAPLDVPAHRLPGGQCPMEFCKLPSHILSLNTSLMARNLLPTEGPRWVESTWQQRCLPGYFCSPIYLQTAAQIPVIEHQHILPVAPSSCPSSCARTGLRFRCSVLQALRLYILPGGSNWGDASPEEPHSPHSHCSRACNSGGLAASGSGSVDF